MGKITTDGRRGMGTRSLEARGRGTTTVMAPAMDCNEFDLLLAEVLDRAQLPPAALLHLAECEACAAVLDDFEAIAGKVRLLAAAEAEPVPDLWPQIRDTLQREGVIHADVRACTPAPKLVKKT